MTAEEAPIVIVGAGQAGGGVAQALVAGGCAGPIVLIGDEAHAPYERPPLSKAVLSGAAPHASTRFWPVETPSGVTVRLSTRVTAVDRASQRVSLDDGTTLAYRRLVLATGGHARALAVPGGEHALCLRGIDDSLRLGARLRDARSALIVGAGFIGLEVAATARTLGLDVTVLEAGSHPCARVLPPSVGARLLALHCARGVDVRVGVQLAGIEQVGSAYRAHLADGARVDADLVVAGIGLQPHVHLAEAAGLDVDNGIVVDAQGRTSDPAIYAAGDVARSSTSRIRFESWANARDQALVVAASLLGTPAPAVAPPWFWSDQFDVNVQVLGVPPMRAPSVVRGAFDAYRGSAFWLDEAGRIDAVVALNAPRDIAVVRRIIARGLCVDARTIGDPEVKLDALLKIAA